MATLNLPVAFRSLLIVPSVGESRPKRLWVDGKATDAPKTDDKGRPLYGFAALAEVNGSRLGEVSVESPMELPNNLPLGAVLRGAGETAEVRVSPKDEWGMRVSLFVTGFEVAGK